MQRYQIVVNGNTYTVTVKSLIGNTAVVDVDGWEFQVAIADGDASGDIAPVIAAAVGSSAAKTRSVPQPELPVPQKPLSPASNKGRKRSSALEDLAPKKTSIPAMEGKGVVSAHLPGLITSILVNIGDTVKAGDIILKMEAMKMENDIRAGIDGTVTDILVEVQQNVLENQPLILIE